MKSLLTDIEKREIADLTEIAISLGAPDISDLTGFRYATSMFTDTPFHWCLKRIDEITEFVEPVIVWSGQTWSTKAK